jgi:hypothetical protein
MTSTQLTEKDAAEHSENIHTQKDETQLAIHNDTYEISTEALGINLPPSYYRSPMFLGTVLVRPHCLPR